MCRIPIVFCVHRTIAGDLRVGSRYRRSVPSAKMMPVWVKFLILMVFRARGCTAIGNSGHPLNQDYDRITISQKGVSDGETQTKKLHPEFKATVVLEALSGESSQAELCRRHNLSEDRLSKWKRQLFENASSLFGSTDKVSSEDAAERIAHLEQLVEKLTVAVDIHKKAAAWLSEKADPDAQDGSGSSE